MKRNIKFIFLFSLLILAFFQLFFILSNNVIAQTSDIDYTFNNEVIYDNTNIPFDTYNNIRNPQSFSKIYNATYSFTNDTIGIPPVDWNVEILGGTVEVINNIEGHNKIVEISDTHAGNSVVIENDFNTIAFGTIELWIRTTNAALENFLQFRSGVDGALIVKIDNDKFQYYDGTYKDVGHIALDNTWYHIRIDFECGAGSYEGLGADTFYIWVNGNKYGAFAFYQARDTLSNTYIHSGGGDSGYTFYIDGVGYSWRPKYEINDNIVPFIYTDDSIIHQDKYAFDFVNKSTLYPNNYNSSFYSGWTEREYSTNNFAYIKHDGNEVAVSMSVNGSDFPFGETYLSKEFSITSNIVNISWQLWFKEFDCLNSLFYINVYSSDKTEIVNIEMKLRGTGSTVPYDLDLNGVEIVSYQNIDVDDVIDFNLYINYNDGICKLNYKLNNILIGNYYQPLKVLGKNGLLNITNWLNPIGSNLLTLYMNEIGVYDNGLSVSNDFAYTTVSLSDNNDNPWYYVRQNIFKIQCEGNYDINPSAGLWNPFNNLINFYNDTIQTSDLITLNTFDYYYNLYYIQNGISFLDLVFHIYGNTSSIISSLEISGVSLNSEGNKFWQDFIHNGTNINENYFYVDDLNRLRYTLTSDDSYLEYIEIFFNITQVSSQNAILGFHSTKTGNSFGNFIVGFIDDTSNIIEFINTRTNYNTIITQNKTIFQFRIIISDNDEFTTGITSGSITFIQLRFTAFAITITILTLIGMMIPLIIIITPSLAISTTYGKNLIVPLFILMSIICLVGNLIPFWLFFIIGFSVISFLFINKESLKEVI